MIEKTYILQSEAGLHSRNATLLVKWANKFNSQIKLEYNNIQVDLKSIMNILSLGVPKGAKIKILIDGEDSEEAILKIDEVINELNQK